MAKQIRAARHYQQRNDPLRRIADRAIPGIKSDLKDSLKGLSELIPQSADSAAAIGDWHVVKDAIDWGHFREVLKATFGGIGKVREAGAQHGAQQINRSFASAGRKVRFRKAGPPDEPRDERGRWTDGGGGAVGSPDHQVGDALKQLPELRQAYNSVPAGKERDALGSFITAMRRIGGLRRLSIEGGRVMQGGRPLGPAQTHPSGSQEYALQEHVWVEPHEALQRAMDQIHTLERMDIGEHTHALRTAVNAVMEAARVRRIVKAFRKDANDQFAFDLYSQEVQDALRAAQDDLIAELETAARDAIDQIILNGARLGLGPDEIMDDIRSMVGLTARQSQAAQNYRDMLESLDPGALQRQLRNFLEDDNVQAALDAGMPMDAAMVDKLTNDYIDNYLDYRAETIAQTEATRAVSLGLQDSYQQAIDRGVFPSEAVKQFWRINPGACEICQSIPDMNPDGVGIDEAFDSVDGPQDAPPDPHPSCRCSIEIVTDLDMVSSDGVDAGEAA
jgi:hypothetical protein